MPGQFAPIAVNIDRVRAVVGSKNRSLLPALKKWFRHWFENVIDEEPDGPELDEVLKGLIAGRPIDPEWSFQFSVAVELLYRHLGTPLSDRCFSSMRIEWAMEVDKAIRQAGIPDDRFGLVRYLFDRGPVIPFPGVIEICMGYLTRQEIRRALTSFAKADYSGLKWDHRVAVAEVRSWLVSCETLGCDLVGFYSG